MKFNLDDFFKLLNNVEKFQTESFYNHTGAYKVPDGYESWLDYWEKNTGRSAKECLNINCENTEDIEGCHVDVVGKSGVWLLPMCRSCNDSRNHDKMEAYSRDLIEVLCEVRAVETIKVVIRDSA